MSPQNEEVDTNPRPPKTKMWTQTHVPPKQRCGLKPSSPKNKDVDSNPRSPKTKMWTQTHGPTKQRCGLKPMSLSQNPTLNKKPHPQ